ncbi:MAG: ABC transporter permease [Methylophilaceae bacterium]|nr:ABC transporter permease [Methylophilaceae bacterium]
MNFTRLCALVRKEMQEIIRDRLYLLLAFLLPVALLVEFGYGMTDDIELVNLAIIDQDHSAASREYAQRLFSTRHFRRVAAPEPADMERALSDGSARAVLWIGSGFERDLTKGRTVDVQVLIDGAFTGAARTINGYLEGMNAQINMEMRSAIQARQGMAAPVPVPLQAVRLQPRFLYNPELRSIVVNAPSLIMLVLMLVPPLLIAVSIVREKETGSIYNIASSTVTRLEFLLGKLLPVVAITMINAVLLWLTISFYFGVECRGSLLQLAFAILLYVLATSGLGLMVSAAVRTQLAAIFITTMTAIIVSTQFSGLFAPLDTAEMSNQFIAKLFPAGYFLPMVRGIYLKGADLSVFWPELLALFIYALVVLWIAHTLFHKRTHS